jgi:hypothetical protein
VYWTEDEKSAMAYPLLSSDLIAGCLLLSSTQLDFFVSASCRTLVQRYAELISLLCDPSDFCALGDIDLVNMLPIEEQYPYIAEFRERVSSIARQKRSSVLDAEPLAWQEIEHSLLRRANTTRSYASRF